VSRDERERLRDIQDAIRAIHDHLGNDRRAEADEPLLHDALLFEFVVIGEAVKNLTAQTRAAAPDVPWLEIAGLRDLIAHEYFRIEIDRILEIVDRDLPALERAVNRLLSV
jgi:uncharacterized protein with HEPN domain